MTFICLEASISRLKWSDSITRKELNKCSIEPTEDEPNSQRTKFTSFKENLSKNIHGLFPFGLANNLDLSFEKVFWLIERINWICISALRLKVVN